MENYYIIIIAILFILAISGLVVGVSNDAVNFLNSAIGSKAAPKWMIFLMASVGVLIGATFSDGMMEIARKGLFNPEMFFFSEVIIIFLAVMITNVILLDIFNTFGMPTSSTVSIVFGLLGAAVAVAAVKIKTAGDSIVLELAQYLNSEKVLAIITGILVSVVIAFTFGAVVQYLARLVFSFNYRKPMKYFGSLYGGLAITAITYFMFIKGMKGSSFASIEINDGEMLSQWFDHHTGLIMLFSLLFWVVLIQLLSWLFKIKVLKVVVLAGTFALAMAFAGNDLVNFIGVPIAGFNAFKGWVSAGAPDPTQFPMTMLQGEVGTPGYMLIISGLIMIATILFSKKAQAVLATSVDLSRQNEGTERFDSSLAARFLVRSATQLNKKVTRLIPDSVLKAMSSRFVPAAYKLPDDLEPPAFDKIRASVNLVVASILIALGTSLKLPLSTTYVTFMVAMGSSLSDGAWDRDSAVYRISGVIAVIGGWFLTAVIAFTLAALVAWVIAIGGNLMIFVFIALAIFILLRTHFMYKSRNEKLLAEEEDTILEEDAFEEIIIKSIKQVVRAMVYSNQIISIGLEGFIKEDRSKLKLAEKTSEEFSKKSKRNKERVYSTVQVLSDGAVDTSHFYVQMMDYKREMAHALHFMLEPMLKHFDNNHKPFTSEQNEEFNELTLMFDSFLNFALHTVKEEKFDNIDALISEREKIFNFIGRIEKNQFKRIKNKEVNTRNSQLFFKINAEAKNLLLHAVNVIKAQRDFIIFTRQFR